MHRTDIWSGAALCLFGLLCITYLIPAYTESSEDFTLQPSLYPSFAAWVITLMGGLLFVSRLLKGKRGADASAGFALKNLWHLVAVVAVLAAAVYAFERAGFVLTGIVLVLILMLYVGERRPLRLIATSVGAPLFIYGVFNLILEMPLP
ncbi:tripartite tricarboxylate transporter TctB family protein [Marinobacterium rhizophilum]|uniref:Tripartite tricarboxylate transporter TctB family protein n=1 Tax=Marinobacterium rhizophilum TaxID=420402 RepID=A0ABY5HIG3_9GAMM|nr:tripartite tricarboxylate transporter TctB family protein [Marinobacterium rhizophilum]UTW11403.1 tripartite tricarboxylate transporter TctB family protein [Marinobacterium rhizophilum]